MLLGLGMGRVSEMAHSAGIIARRISPIVMQLVSAEPATAFEGLERGEDLSIEFRFGE